MKVLVADKFEAEGVQGLKSAGCEVVVDPELKDDALVKAIGRERPAVLVVRSTKVAEPMLAASDTLKLVIRAGAGYDTIAVDAATKRDIRVANCPGKNSVAVAELVFAHLLARNRRIVENVNDLRASKWNKKEYSKARGIKGLAMGIVGVGQVGREVARRALAFEMRVLYTDIVAAPDLDQTPGVRRVELDALLASSDVVTLHVPLMDATRHLINPERLKLMKPDAMLINTSRGGIVDEKAVAAALSENRLGSYAADVYENEPPATGTTIDAPIVKAPRVYGTHHIGASTTQAQVAVAEEVVRIVREFKTSGKVFNCVNPG